MKALLLAVVLFALTVTRAEAVAPYITCAVAPQATLGQPITATVTTNRSPVYVVFMAQDTEITFGPLDGATVTATYTPQFAGSWRVHVASAHPGGKVPLQTNCYVEVLP